MNNLLSMLTGYYSLSYMILIVILSYASIKDIQSHAIPNKLIVFGIIAGVIVNCLFFSYLRIIDSLIAFILAGGILFLISLMSKGGVGMGDVKLVACMGLLLGIEKTLSVMIISFIASAIFGIFLMLVKKYNSKSSMPFVPFILLGIVVTIFIT